MVQLFEASFLAALAAQFILNLFPRQKFLFSLSLVEAPDSLFFVDESFFCCFVLIYIYIHSIVVSLFVVICFV